MKKKVLWMLTVIMTYGFLITSCSSDDTPVVPPTDEVETLLKQMTLREKVGQMFYIRIESLDPSIEWTTYDDLAALKNQEITMKMRQTNEQYPVGGIILYAWNMEDEAQLATIIPQVRSLKVIRCSASTKKVGGCHASPTIQTLTSRNTSRWLLSVKLATRRMPMSVAIPLVRT